MFDRWATWLKRKLSAPREVQSMKRRANAMLHTLPGSDGLADPRSGVVEQCERAELVAEADDDITGGIVKDSAVGMSPSIQGLSMSGQVVLSASDDPQDS